MVKNKETVFFNEDMEIKETDGGLVVVVKNEEAARKLDPYSSLAGGAEILAVNADERGLVNGQPDFQKNYKPNPDSNPPRLKGVVVLPS